jgi:cell division protein ZapA (FtsZ GTPase activity inhibitor)
MEKKMENNEISESINTKLGHLLEEIQTLRNEIKGLLGTINPTMQLVHLLKENNTNLRETISFLEKCHDDNKYWRDANEVLGP